MSNSKPNFQNAQAAQAGQIQAGIKQAETLLRSRKPGEAVVILDKLAKAAPGHPGILALRAAAISIAEGPLQQRAGEALEGIQAALKARPDHPPFLLVFARLLVTTRKFKQAENVLIRLHDLQSPSPETLTLLGVAFHYQNRFQESIEPLKLSLKANDKNPLTLETYALSLMAMRNHRKACALLKKVIEIQPERPRALVHLTPLLVQFGEFDLAEELLGRLKKIVPNSPDIISIGAMLAMRTTGKEAALEILRPAIPEKLDHRPIASVYAELSVEPEQAEAAYQNIKALVEKESAGGKPDTELGPLFFLCVSLCERIGRHEEAFGWLTRAKALVKDTSNHAGFESLIGRLKSQFTKGNFAKLPSSGLQDETPLFIVGMPRSGTSLVEQILASHPYVHGAGELPHIQKLISHLEKAHLQEGINYPESLLRDSPQALDKVARKYIEALRKLAPDAVRVTDKLPYNYLHLGFISLLFPKARVVFCLRDPIDNCLSCYFQNFASRFSFMYKLKDLGFLYRHHLDLYRHWKEHLPIPMHTVQYEDMVRDPENQIRSLVEFAGLPWDDACLRHHESKRVVKTASWDQAVRPIYQTSVNRYAPYHPFAGELIEALGDLVKRDKQDA